MCWFGILNQICDVQNQTFAFGPADAGICNGLAVDVLADLLAAVFQVAFDHKALDHGLDVGGMAAGYI